MNNDTVIGAEIAENLNRYGQPVPPVSLTHDPSEPTPQPICSGCGQGMENCGCFERFAPTRDEAIAHARLLIAAIDTYRFSDLDSEDIRILTDALFSIPQRTLIWYDDGHRPKTFANSRAAETGTHRITAALCDDGSIAPTCEKCGRMPADCKVNSYWMCSSCGCAAVDAIDRENEHESGPLPVAFAGRVSITETGEPILRAGQGRDECSPWMLVLTLIAAVVLIGFFVIIAISLPN